MREAFKTHKFSHAKKLLLGQIIRVVESYQKQGYKLTLRQLYYQLVAGGIIPNVDKEYAKLSSLLTDARMAGYIDWDVIEDRGRVPHMPSEWESLDDFIESAIYSFRLERWKGQQYHVELWTEKDALTSVLLPITRKYHVSLVVNKGYSSASAMYQAAQRMHDAESDGKHIVVLYLGDHDPSGLDMDRDIRDRLEIFEVSDFEVLRIGLTIEQIKKLNPPPNPAKLTDSRSQKYVAEHGKYSWEVDAIPPQELNRLVRKAIESCMDMDEFNDIVSKEDKLKKKLRNAVSKIK